MSHWDPVRTFAWIVVVLFLSDTMTLGVEKSRVFVLTDISNEPDDEESMVRFLVYANEYDVEGLVATTSTWLRGRTREDLIRRQLDAYGMVLSNLSKHAKGHPSKESLLAVTATGQPKYGMAAVGKGKSTAGSKLLLAAMRKDDPRPLWVSVWGGVNTLAQTLLDAREALPADDLDRISRKIRVYTISDQDDAGRWIRTQFPNVFYIVSPSSQDHRDYYQATWTGIAGDRHYRNGPGVDFELVDHPWLEENIIRGHGPLGALYPKVAYIMEGDTPSFLGLVENGLGWTNSPAYGGWAGRYARRRSYAESAAIWTESASSRDTVVIDGKDGRTHTSHQATIWRWRRHFQHDFAARMDWCVADDFSKANHNPLAVLSGDRSKKVIEISAKPGETVRLSAEGSTDPDGDELRHSWFVYREAGTLRQPVTLSADRGSDTSFTVPKIGARAPRSPTIHVILVVEDDGSPSLVSYRRAVVTVQR